MNWISVEERLPLDDETVLVIDNTLSTFPHTLPILAYYDEEEKGFISCNPNCSFCIRVTHWIRLPEPPEK